MKQGNHYSKYYLSENPFPVVPIPEERPKIYGANKGALERIVWQLQKVARTNRPIHIVLVGPYGSGKTHLLRYLANLASKQIKGALAAYVPHPGPDFTSIYRRFIDSIGYERLRSLSERMHEEQLKREIIYHDFVTALAGLNDDDKTIEAWRWLTANSLTLEERRALGVSAAIDHTEKALNAFSALLRFMRTVGFRLISMLIDEFEEINSLVHLQKRRLINDLRHLIDCNVSNFSLTVACTPHGWETVYEENAALVRRFSSNVVFLEPLEEEVGGFLISEYLTQYRTDPGDFLRFVREKNFDEETSQTFPFTRDAIEEICSLSRGNIGEVLKYSGIAIDLGISEGHPVITPEIFRSLVSKYYGRAFKVHDHEDLY